MVDLDSKGKTVSEKTLMKCLDSTTFWLCQLNLMRNALIQPHFDYASSTWYPNLNKILNKNRLYKMSIFHSVSI